MTQISKSLTENWRNHLRLFLGILSLAGLQLLLTMQLRIHFEPVAEGVQQGAEHLDPSLFRVVSFGQMPSAIDWIFLRSLQDPTLEHVKKGEHLPVYYDLDLLTDLDPLFLNAYFLGVNLLAVVHDDGIGALNILLKGQTFRKTELPTYPESFCNQYWRDEWQIPLLLAYTYLFEMDDLPHAEEAYEEAARFPGAPLYLQTLVEQFHQKDGQYAVGLRLLDFLLAGQKDARARERLMQRKFSLEVAKYVFDVNQMFREFKTKNKSQTSLTALWRKFLVHQGISDIDPWNGALDLDAEGRVITSTPHQKVFGLE